MTEIIRGRINQLQQGIIPEGYHKTKAGIMPDDWDDIVKAKHIFKSHTDKKHNGDLEILAATQENGIVPRSQIGIDIQCSEEGISGYKKVSKGDFVISLRSFQGGIEYSEYDGIVSPAYTVLKPKKVSAADIFETISKQTLSFSGSVGQSMVFVTGNRLDTKISAIYTSTILLLLSKKRLQRSLHNVIR